MSSTHLADVLANAPVIHLAPAPIAPFGALPAERPEPTLAQQLAGADYPSLLEMRANVLAQIASAQDVRDAIHAAIQNRMVREGATSVYHEEYDVKIVRSEKREYDGERLLGLLTDLANEGACDPKVVGKAIHAEPKTHETYLNQLRKLGGAVLAAIDAATTAVHPEERLSITVKK